MKMANVVKRGHFHIRLMVLLGLFSSWAASESNLLSLEDARKFAVSSTSLASSRIVGGSPASPNQFPHQVAVLRNDGLCGGSLITAKWVLTAAHCVYNGQQVVPPSLIQILAGTIYLNKGGIRRNVRRVIPHERYGNLRNDIAVLELTQTYKLSSSIATVALRRSPVPKASRVTISGWGRLSSNGPLPSVLQYNQAIVLPPFGCQLETGISTGVICLLSPVNNGACFGDSGGPAIYNNQLVGVASFAYNGCGTSRSDGYAQVSDFVQWIEEKIK